MSRCPFHDLPHGETVMISTERATFPMSASRACAQWHLAELGLPQRTRAVEALTRAWDHRFTGTPKT